MKILVNTPYLEMPGGVANHYKGLRPYWSYIVHYNFIAGRRGIPGSVILPFDLLVFIFKLLIGRYDVVLLNPSLGKNAIKRDALFLKIASWFRVKKIVFFHGWEDGVSCSISQNPSWFLKWYGGADSFIVLADEFRQQLLSWGIRRPIFLTTTKVDNFLVDCFDITKKQFNSSLLFLARVEDYKGIFTAIKSYEILKKNHPELKFTVAGSGSALEDARNLILKNGTQDVTFCGNVSGELLRTVFSESDIYILPTDGEGMPATVLEAMAFGLPVITRPVGGINDFFRDGKMGFLISSKDPEDFARAVDRLLSDHVLLKNISLNNYKYAAENFMSSRVCKKIEDVFIKTCNL